MADETTGTGTGQTTPSDAQTEQQHAETAAANPPAGAQPTEHEKTIAAAAAAARRDADAKRKEAETRATQLQTELDAANATLEAQRIATLSEEQRKEEERAATAARAVELEAQLAAERTARLRAEAVSVQCPTLPAAYKALVSGSTPEEIAASIAAAQQQYQQDNTGRLTVTELEGARALTPEARLDKYGPDAGAALNELFKTTAHSVGTPSNLGGQPAPGQPSKYAEQMAAVGAAAAGPARENALLAALAAKQ